MAYRTTNLVARIMVDDDSASVRLLVNVEIKGIPQATITSFNLDDDDAAEKLKVIAQVFGSFDS